MRHWLTTRLMLLLLVATPLLLAGGKGDAAAGKAVYAKKCAICHGKAGEGKKAIAKMLKVELRPLGSREVQAKSDAELRKNIVKGNGKMKPVKGLSDQEVANLIAHLRRLAKK